MVKRSSCPPLKPVWLTIKQSRQVYNLSERFLYKMIAAGKLRSTKVGYRRLVSTESLNELLAAGE